MFNQCRNYCAHKWNQFKYFIETAHESEISPTTTTRTINLPIQIINNIMDYAVFNSVLNISVASKVSTHYLEHYRTLRFNELFFNNRFADIYCKFMNRSAIHLHSLVHRSRTHQHPLNLSTYVKNLEISMTERPLPIHFHIFDCSCFGNLNLDVLTFCNMTPVKQYLNVIKSIISVKHISSCDTIFILQHLQETALDSIVSISSNFDSNNTFRTNHLTVYAFKTNVTTLALEFPRSTKNGFTALKPTYTSNRFVDVTILSAFPLLFPLRVLLSASTSTLTHLSLDNCLYCEEEQPSFWTAISKCKKLITLSVLRSKLQPGLVFSAIMKLPDLTSFDCGAILMTTYNVIHFQNLLEWDLKRDVKMVYNLSMIYPANERRTKMVKRLVQDAAYYHELNRPNCKVQVWVIISGAGLNQQTFELVHHDGIVKGWLDYVNDGQ